jgi:hypothetical protein
MHPEFLPWAHSDNERRLFAASQVQASSAPSGDLLGGLGRSSTPVAGGSSSSSSASAGPFDSIIAIGVLIKGDTVHFEHIAETVSRGLMRIQLDFGVPVIFGLLVSRPVVFCYPPTPLCWLCDNNRDCVDCFERRSGEEACWSHCGRPQSRRRLGLGR